ncbi:hypothetical protein FRC08_014276 [Ceratobasidium sp. 394]|nr:hypothetical protein FRC08_014276 [Ceratobasidium sp. 394]
MPAVDPIDQKAARDIESSLREGVARRQRPQVELDWLLALPKRIRRSGKLLEAAQAEARVLLEHVRSAWTRATNAECEREERLARAKSQPRDLECLRAPDPAAWNGLGRRKRRCRAFDAVGRAYNIRHRPSDAIPGVPTSPTDVQCLHPLAFLAPNRPPTPPGLRLSMLNAPGLLSKANGPANPADYGLPSPNSPTPPASPPSPALPVPTLPPPPDFPCSPRPGEFTVRGHEIDPDMAYVVAQGRYAHSPRQGYSAQEAAVDIYFVEEQFPGALEYLAGLLFPRGVGQWDSMVVSAGLEPLVDFVHGWFDLSKRACAVS